ncbi:MAG: acyl-CoA thioesterase [Alphaproteobacteria bacterium]|nr:acyl-CoA thioesterase [Alphaproteobacteria bacterium]
MSDPDAFVPQFAFDVTAEPAHIDELGHVNHKVYVAWAEEAGVRHWRAIADADDQARWIWVASRLEVDFLRETLAGETLRVETRVGAPRGARFDRHVRIVGADGKPKAKVLYTWALIDAVTRRPARVPPALAAQFTQA